MKGCFIYLVNHTEQAVADGVRSLALLKANYLDRFPTPVLLFHEAGLTEEMKRRLSAEVDAQFVPVDFSSYPHGAADPAGSWSLGYLNMCRFFANEVFHHPALEPFDYYCRLDTDSFILVPVAYDIFKRAADVRAFYGFVNDALCAPPEYCGGFSDALRRFGVTPSREGGLYYTNFEVCYLPWFRTDPWRTFFAFIDTEDGIYAHRWGDHLIRYAGVKALMPTDRVLHYTDIAYSHQGIGASHAA